MEIVFLCREMPCDGARQKQKKTIMEYKMGQEVILKIKEEKDLGVVIQDTLSPEWHKVNYSTLPSFALSEFRNPRVSGLVLNSYHPKFCALSP